MISLKNESLFYKLYGENRKLVRNVLYNMVGTGPLDDLTQETFLKIWKNLSLFNFRSSIKTWVYRITVNVAIDFLRSRRQKTEKLDDNYGITDDKEDIKDKEKIVQQALMCLDDVHRSVVVLYYFEDLKIQDIAKILNTAEGTVKSRLYFAKQKLRSYLEQQEIELL
jgi:RNA polymerase sigma-70 factor, ECF subfamily